MSTGRIPHGFPMIHNILLRFPRRSHLLTIALHPRKQSKRTFGFFFDWGFVGVELGGV